MTSINLSELLTDDAVLAEIGARLARRRLDLQLTQADLAEQAGVAKRTVERIEAGASTQLSTLVRLLRVLDLLPRLDQAIPEQPPRPMDLLRRKGKQRQRASSRGRQAETGKPWAWNDEP
ncbi:MAG: helix-turn-helix transcriptional regulator [Xanthomonadales bacterium]|jgi:transcriptional regulator with XRE-family HTH domain|nr:helix-turn-helix transcriptional regulator [Xanthomonadales bacterium]